LSSNVDKSKTIIKINAPLKWIEWMLTQQARSLRFVQDEEGNLWSQPIVIAGLNPQEDQINIAPVGRHYEPTGMDEYALHVKASMQLYNVAEYALETQRTPNIFKTNNGTSDYTVWDPAAGKRFRLMSFQILLSKEVACAGALNITLLDATETICTFPISSAALVAMGQIHCINVVLPGNGYLSVAADNTLIVGFSANLTAGLITMNAQGTEE